MILNVWLSSVYKLEKDTISLLLSMFGFSGKYCLKILLNRLLDLGWIDLACRTIF